MISGHLEIADRTVISAATQVYDSIRVAGVYTGAFPALPHREWTQVASQTRRLRQLADRVRMLEKALEEARQKSGAGPPQAADSAPSGGSAAAAAASVGAVSDPPGEG